MAVGMDLRPPRIWVALNIPILTTGQISPTYVINICIYIQTLECNCELERSLWIKPWFLSSSHLQGQLLLPSLHPLLLCCACILHLLQTSISQAGYPLRREAPLVHRNSKNILSVNICTRHCAYLAPGGEKSFSQRTLHKASYRIGSTFFRLLKLW